MEYDAERVIEGAIWIDPDRMSGAPCFLGTRVPVEMFWNHLEAGGSVEEFLEAFPWVERTHITKVLAVGKEPLAELLEAA